MNDLTDNTFYDPIMADLIPGYIQSQKETMQSLREALERRDYPTVSAIAHRIKGSAACYGFKNYGELATELEGIAQKRDHGSCVRVLGLMQAEFLAS